MLIAVSFFFYYWGETRIWILVYYISCNFILGIWLEKAKESKKQIRILGIILNLAPLFYYKYLGLFGLDVGASLPLGISFFGFQGISYLVDISKKVYPAQRSLVKFTFFKSFFAPLLAGPLFRYSNISGTIEKPLAVPQQGLLGIQRFIRGLAKKAIFADSIARFVDLGFENANQLNFGLTWLVLFCFSLQIYFDFSGYSDMAIGLHEYFGLKIPENFNRPFEATSMTDFWRRWHMTLSSWFKDYLYIPLGGNRESSGRTYFNKILVFLLCGLWHGGSWLFAGWGLLHGLSLVFEKIFAHINISALIRKIFGPIYVFIFVSFSWILFRSQSLPVAFDLFKSVAGLKENQMSWTKSLGYIYHYESSFYYFLFIVALVLATVPRNRLKVPFLFSWPTHLLLLLVSFVFLISANHHPFIYFRF